ncbi:hypothetical protein BC939DRAFT_475928 [Gamsiella multidivaricata]|uniref:uncharacterized protein n=1 Tax=Gamsiella multidivaricata TaxID=101098 RepID=UPI00221F3898|nr:uncharacterized protein BC939DRAFT_475928 [Gamsiella multidivaricata]KAI7825970.1 hypothetical protein BC939DRAFT_475928 [Gamsiella multidivaricata]
MDLTLFKQGCLEELTELEKLRHLHIQTDFWSRMGQAEVEFMEAQWPMLGEITFGGLSKDTSQELSTEVSRFSDQRFPVGGPRTTVGVDGHIDQDDIFLGLLASSLLPHPPSSTARGNRFVMISIHLFDVPDLSKANSNNLWGPKAAQNITQSATTSASHHHWIVPIAMDNHISAPDIVSCSTA